MELVIADTVAMETRLARLACMPPDADLAIMRMKSQVRGMWMALGVSAAPLVPRALQAAASHLPGLWNCRPHDLEDVLDLLDRVLPNHHPEEIRVASFALLCGLVELVREELGADSVAALLAALEHSRT